MAKPNEISSTERLLRLIRGAKTPPQSSAPESPGKTSRSAARKTRPFRLSLSLKKKSTVGIDIGRSDIKMVEMQGVAEGKPVVARYETVAFEKDLVVESPRFPAFLKSALGKFLRGMKDVPIWAAIPSTNVDTRYLRIPKVPKTQVANAVYWSHRREHAFNEKESLFDFDVIGEVTEEGAERLAVVSCVAPRQEIQTLQKIFAKSGFSLTGISIVPFAIQNLLRTGWLRSDGANICSLFIGKDWSRIAIFANDNLVLMRDIKTGLQSMVEVIAEDLSRKLHTSPKTPDEEELSIVSLEEPGPDADTAAAWDLFGRFLEGRLPEGEDSAARPSDGPVLNEEAFRVIVPVLDRVVRQVERTLDHFYLNVGSERVKTVYISGPLIAQERVIDYVASQLGIPLELLEPFAPDLSGAMEVVPPEAPERRGAFVPALGLALSTESRTPNFLHTYRDREKARQVRRRNQAILAATAVLFVILGGFFFWQMLQLQAKKVRVARLQQELDRYVPQVDQNLILQLATQAVGDYTDVEAYAERYLGLAVLSEIVQTVPENVRIWDLRIELGPKAGSGGVPRQRVAVIVGVVLGDRLDFESTLAGYLVRLESSSLFHSPEVTDQGTAYLADEPVLRFTAKFVVL